MSAAKEMKQKVMASLAQKAREDAPKQKTGNDAKVVKAPELVAQQLPVVAEKTNEPVKEVGCEATLKVKAKESYKRLRESSAEITASSKMIVDGIAEKVEVYYIHAKDGVMEIIGKVGEQLIVIKAKVCEVGSASGQKLKEFSFTVSAAVTSSADRVGSGLKAKTVWLQEGYVYLTTTVDGQVVFIKAKASNMVEIGQTKANSAYASAAKAIDDYTAIARSKALGFYDVSKARAQLALEPLKPHYLKVHNGVANIVANVGNRIVVVQVHVGEVVSTTKVRMLESIAGAQVAMNGYVSPLTSRVSTLCGNFQTRVEQYTVSIQHGVLYLRGAAGEYTVHLRGSIESGIGGAKKAILDLMQNLSSVASAAYGRTSDRARMLYSTSKDGILHVVFQVKERVVVLRIKVADVVDYIQAKSLQVYTPAMNALTDACGAARTRLLQAAEVAKSKSMEVGAKGRVVIANPSVRMTAASAAGGAAALGATGATLGGALGVVSALPAAFFTFGLSIPVGAAIGAGSGACIGGATGFVSGGATGYAAHKHKDKIGSGFDGVLSKANVYRGIAADSTSKLRAKVLACTGSTFASPSESESEA